MTSLEWSIAWRYLRSRRASALLSFISTIAIGGVIVGVSALIVIIGVMNGLQIDLREKILIGSPDVRVLSYGEDLRLRNWQGALDTIRAQPGVVAAAPFVMTQAMVANRAGYVRGVQLQGIPPEGPGVANVTAIRQHATDGDFRFASGDGRRRGAVIGEGLATLLSVRVGDTISVFSLAGNRITAMTYARMVQPEPLVVTGIFRTEMYEYDNLYMYIDFDLARRIAGLGDDASGIEVKTTDRARAVRVAAQLDSALGFPRRTEDWSSQNASLFHALKLEKLAMAVILLLIVLVAAFNIVSTLTMVVRDKTREIGILKTMGLASRSVRNVFLVQGLVIGLAGTLVGLALGLAAGIAIDRYRLIPLEPQVYFIDHLPVVMQVGDTLLIVLASVMIATIATLYPAKQASRLMPVQAIRDE
ncbi:MAG TPA: FtsX-like permease family protein [Gemmatimonadaceae bacterium]|nr:FtsX-like permease family protein [Gemmatimonadaceae bacterium]